MHLRNSIWLAAALSGGLALAAAGQTGRIALASHAGRVAAGSADNFGIVPKREVEWRSDSLVYLNDSLLMHVGQKRSWIAGSPHHENAIWYRRAEQEWYNYQLQLSPQASFDNLRQRYPHATFIGFEKLLKRSKKKKSGEARTHPRRPFQYSYWRGLATVAALGAVGWLLGRKPKHV